MSYVIFIISIIGICLVCFLVENKSYLKYEEENKDKVEIVLTISHADYSTKKEIIEKIMCGNYENILDIVDNVQIN